MGAHGAARDRRTRRLSVRPGPVKRRSGGSITPGMLIRLTTLAGLAGIGGDPPTTEEERYRLTIARFGALVFVGDALLIFTAAAIGGRTPIAGVVIPAVATAMTVCFLVGYRRLSLLVCQLLSITGMAMIAGRGRHYRASHYPIRGAGGRITLIAAIIDDVTEIKETEVRLARLLADEQAARLELEGIRRQLTARNEQLAAQAATDPLTKLANRAAFDEHLTIALAYADRDRAAVGVVYIDLDGFKEINDRYGHGAGDQLEAVAGRLTSHRHSNDVIARIGGDEFLLLLTDLEPRTARETLAAIATRIQGAIAAPIMLRRHGLVGISSSVGTSLYPDDAAGAAELVAAADRAMYRRKRAA